MTTPEEGLEKAALLLLTLGPDEAAEVLKHLGPREVQKLGEAMTSMKSIPQEEVETVLQHFNEVADQRPVIRSHFHGSVLRALR